MTVRDIIAEGLVIQGERNKKVIDDKVYEMLELVGLVRDMRPGILTSFPVDSVNVLVWPDPSS